MLRRAAASRVPTGPVVLVPLYIYPDPDQWSPLYTALSENPSLNFTVVVNPNSGPGSIVPDEHYLRELKTLSTYGNARTVGYVSTDYSKRDINLVKQDILTYKQWDASYAVTGIFFDETPSHFDPAIASYLTTINGTVRNASHGFGPKAMIIHNPGMIPDKRYMGATGPDLTVVFEAAYETWFEHNFSQTIAAAKLDPSRLASIVHTLPAGLSQAEISSFVKQVKSITSSVFVTELAEDMYSSFGSVWLSFVRDMA